MKDSNEQVKASQGNRQITIWAWVGLLCVVVCLMLATDAFGLSNLVFSIPIMSASISGYNVAVSFVCVLGLIGVAISIVTLFKRHQASNSGLVTTLGTVSLGLMLSALALLALAFLIGSQIT
jgi:uncharacterized membrane protein